MSTGSQVIVSAFEGRSFVSVRNEVRRSARSVPSVKASDGGLVISMVRGTMVFPW